MTSRFVSQLLMPFPRRPFAVSGIVLLCLISQLLLPGLENWTPSASNPQAGVSDCCVAALAKAASGCCCGPSAEVSCGCACGTKKSTAKTVRPRKPKSSDESSSIQSEICGCGGKHRPGMIPSIEPAVIDSIDEIIDLKPSQLVLDAFCHWSGKLTPPPTPPPEFCV